MQATRAISETQRARWPDATATSYLEATVAAHPEGTAVVDHGRSLTYAELHRASCELAAGLAELGVGRGDVVLMQLPNWWEACVTYQATMRLGAVICPVVTIYRERELSFILQQAQPKVVVTAGAFRGHPHAEMFTRITPGQTPILVARGNDLPADDRLRALDDVPVAGGTAADASSPGDVCLLMYTSGTTADPKGVLHSHQTLIYENDTIVELGELDADDTVFMPSPVTHITGFLYGLLLPPMTGTSVVLLDIWDPSTAVQLIEDHTCTFTVGATPFLQGLVQQYRDAGRASAMDLFLCGGADVPPELVREATEVMGATVGRIYGSTEFPTFSSGRPGDPLDVRAETDGVPIGDAEGRLADVVEEDGIGELEVRGPELFLGYLDDALNAEAFRDGDWFRTGDLASIDENGAVTIRGRAKDIIIRGGENISAKEVEDLLYAHPRIREVAVVGMPDPVMVERACAFVVPEDTEPLELAHLTTFLDAYNIARQKYPERIEVVDELPKTASGKIQKFVLRDRIRQLLDTGTRGSNS